MVGSSRRRYRKEQEMRKVLSITLGFLIAGISVAVAQAQSDPVGRIIAQEDAKGVILHSTSSGPTRPPDTADAASLAQLPGHSYGPRSAADVRPPDVQDATHAGLTPTVLVVAKGGFDWGDAP